MLYFILMTSVKNPTCFYQKYVEMTGNYKDIKIYIYTIQIYSNPIFGK